MKQFIPLCLLLFWVTAAHSQLSVSHLSTKGYSSTGFSFYINDARPLKNGDAITIEGSVDYYRHAIATPLPLFGYRRIFSGRSDGWYIEPQIGYLFVAPLFLSDSTKSTPRVPDNAFTNRTLVTGPIAGLSAGYSFPGSWRLNLGLRYEHVFTIGDAAMNIVSLRLMHTLICGRWRYRRE